MRWLVVKAKELFNFKFNIQIHFLVHIELYGISVNELTFLLLKRELLFVCLLAVLEFQVEGRDFFKLSEESHREVTELKYVIVVDHFLD